MIAIQLSAEVELFKESHPVAPKDAAAEAQIALPELNEVQRADIKLMWETVLIQEGHKEKASSDRAQEAANRVFKAISITGLTRNQLIGLLGDPKTSSDSIYNFAFYPSAKGDLVYRFDTGTHGWQFNVSFDQNDRVSGVKPIGIE